MIKIAKKLLSVFVVVCFCGAVAPEAHARSCKAQQALMNQRCKQAKKKPSRTNKKACANATNRYNSCLGSGSKR